MKDLAWYFGVTMTIWHSWTKVSLSGETRNKFYIALLNLMRILENLKIPELLLCGFCHLLVPWPLLIVVYVDITFSLNNPGINILEASHAPSSNPSLKQHSATGCSYCQHGLPSPLFNAQSSMFSNCTSFRIGQAETINVGKMPKWLWKTCNWLSTTPQFCGDMTPFGFL